MYRLPFSSASGYIQNVCNITPVAFSGGDIDKEGLHDCAVLSRNVRAAGAIAGTIILFNEVIFHKMENGNA
jgi:hypothetical protein